MDITISTTDVLTHKKAAEELGITTMTLWRWIKSEKIRPVRFGRYSVIPISEIERLKNGQLSREVIRPQMAEEKA